LLQIENKIVGLSDTWHEDEGRRRLPPTGPIGEGKRNRMCGTIHRGKGIKSTVEIERGKMYRTVIVVRKRNEL
jgi:hypothetical protein